MKLKHYALLLFVIAIAIASCTHGDPNGLITYYTYVNQTANTISVKVYWDDKSFKLQHDFEIIAGGEYQLRVYVRMCGGIGSPFTPQGKKQLVIVSNGEKGFTQYRGDGAFPKVNSLFDKDTYEEIQITKTEAYYKYVFTDKDFENAKPIEPQR